jgi:predicted ArsR family transcriptional regulator
MSETITRDEWLAEFERVLREIPQRNDEGLTAREISAALGIGPKAILEKLRLLGPRVVAGRKTITDMAGRQTTTFCYRLRPESPDVH